MIQPRYIVKWSNGAWKIFDRVQFKDVAAFGLRSTAQKSLKVDQ